jgi:hypothetical protein
MEDTGADVTIGVGESSGGYFTGLINEVAIWDEALDADAVTALYNSGTPLDATADSGNYDNSDGLQGYWRNDGDTTWTDRSTNSNDGTVSGSPDSIVLTEGLTSGRDSQGFYLTDTTENCLTLNGAEYVEIPDSDVLPFTGNANEPFTIEAWISIDDLTALNGVIGKSTDAFYIRCLSSGRVEVFLKGSGGGYIKQEPSSVTSAGWHHLIVTYDGSGNKDNINIFWDSSEQTNTSSESGTYTSLADTSNTVHIGSINGSSEFGGMLDDVRIYDVVLSDAEITKNYNAGKSKH